MTGRLFLLWFLLACHFPLEAALKPGFQVDEVRKMLLLSAHSSRMGSYYRTLPIPKGFEIAYRSKTTGLDNTWDLWLGPDSLCVVAIRGSTQRMASWVANFYAAMVPAKGCMVMEEGQCTGYRLSHHEQASVHAGWLYCMLSMWPEMRPVIDSLHAAGFRDLIVTGHSQGGALANLLTAHLKIGQADGNLPKDWRIKTYATAPPKPGNLHFAHSYAQLTLGGWAWNLILTADWVPETPVTLQTLSDFNLVNPFKHSRFVEERAPFPGGLIYRGLVGLLDAPGKRAMRRYRFFLGSLPERFVSSEYPGFEPPDYAEGLNYVRAGETRYLFADEAYFQAFPQDPDRPFIHHLHGPYLYLLHRQESIARH